MKEVITVKKVSKLANIKGVSIPKLFKQRVADRNEDGQFVDEYRSLTLIGTSETITPYFHNGSWCFDGDDGILQKLVKDIGLKDKKGNVIEHSNKTRYDDDFFSHEKFMFGYRLKGGFLTLDPSNPADEFMYLCLRSDPRVKFPGKKLSGYEEVRYELVERNKEREQKFEEAKVTVDNIVLLSSMNEEKMKALVDIFDLSTANSKSDYKTLFLSLKSVAESEDRDRNFGMKKCDLFYKYANKTDEEIFDIKNIVLGKRKGIIRKRKDGFSFDGVSINVKNDDQLIEYFRDGKNIDLYAKLIDVIEVKG